MVESIAVSQQELQLYVDEMVTLAVSSNVIAAVPRTENIYEATCNILIKEMGLRMAWVGIAGEDGRTHAIAACGREAGYLSAVEEGWGGSADGSAPSERAISTMHPQVVNDLGADPSGPLEDRGGEAGIRVRHGYPAHNVREQRVERPYPV
jgi:hypothetical protein